MVQNLSITISGMTAKRERLDPFELSEIIDQKLQGVWDLARYRYKTKDITKNTKDLKEQLSIEEILEEISQIF